MNEQDPILANELNRRINAEMQGKAKPPVSEAIQPEAELAAKLINLAQDTHPDPDFVTNLGSQLARRAARKQQLQNKAAPPERPSFWRQLEQLLKEGTTMNRNKYLLGALGVVALVLVGTYVLFNRGNNNNNSESVADATGSEVQTEGTDSESVGQPTSVPNTTDEAVEVADLPALPAIGASDQATGLGGGGVSARPMGGGGGGIEGAALAADGSFIFTDPFSGTVFTLNTTLPTEPRLATVLQNLPSEALLLEQAQDLANRLGFSTQMYREQYQVYEAQPGERVYEPPIVYYLFDGSRTLIVDQWSAYYNDSSIITDFENPISFEAAVPIAEAFLQEHGLLNFEYEVQQIWGSDVNFVRTIDGERNNQPEITVGVSSDGRVYSVSYQGLRNVETLGRYPIISAQEAWEILQGGVVENNILYQFIAQPEQAIEQPIAIDDPIADLYQFWVREYAPGEEIHLYEWPVVYLPVGSDGNPRIQLRNYVIQTDPATLGALAERVGQQTHVWGQIGSDGTTLELAGWEPVDPNFQPATTGQGIITRSGDQVLFTDTNTGQVFIVPNVPSDLEDGTEVYLFAWAARDLGQAYPVLDWENMDKIITFPPTEEVLPVEPIEEPLPIDGPFEPFTYQSVTVNEVSLAYYTTYSWPTNENGDISYDGQPTIIVQPTWKFSGETNDGYFVEFFIQAPQPEYLNR